MKKARASRRSATWVLIAASLLFAGLVIYRSFQVAGYRCSVCVAFRGQEVCRTVDGPTEHDARMGATTNACAFLAAGVTDSLACERTAPVRVDCSAIN